ncbi:MAG: phosphoadenylyl-sulfate reductase [Ignavibacteriae bacterium]|nr:MAG: phosphoadenylyl-sulfate reductase [Ignavibacteriota bacterium]
MPVSEYSIADFLKEVKNYSPEELLLWSLRTFEVPNVVFASSLGAEDQVITDMLMNINPHPVICTLDTGRLPEQTYRLMDTTREKYGFRYRVLFPDYRDVETMVSNSGQNLFYESVEKRKQCCAVRKVYPLRRAFKGLSAWICGLRKEQSESRASVGKVEWDDNFGLYKINPLCDWTNEQVWEYLRKHQVPYNTLHDHGYPTIGCDPCTRAIRSGDQSRAGRWWWESAEHKECGLHSSEHAKVREPNGIFKRA